MIRHVGCSLSEKIKMETINPVRAIGKANRKGSLEVGKDADLIIIDADVNIYI